MISVQVFIFAGVSKHYKINEYQAIMKFTYFLSSRDSYGVPVRKLIFLSFNTEKFRVDKFMDQIIDHSLA